MISSKFKFNFAVRCIFLGHKIVPFILVLAVLVKAMFYANGNVLNQGKKKEINHLPKRSNTSLKNTLSL